MRVTTLVPEAGSFEGLADGLLHDYFFGSLPLCEHMSGNVETHFLVVLYLILSVQTDIDVFLFLCDISSDLVNIPFETP